MSSSDQKGCKHQGVTKALWLTLDTGKVTSFTFRVPTRISNYHLLSTSVAELSITSSLVSYHVICNKVSFSPNCQLKEN